MAAAAIERCAQNKLVHAVSFHEARPAGVMGQQLQFFVKTYLDGRTIVLHGHPFDTVESVHRQIHLKTGLPLAEQRLIYLGRQLQLEHTLAQCHVANDSTLFLVARMRSVAPPTSWTLLSHLVHTIERSAAVESMCTTPRVLYRLSQDHRIIKSGLEFFLDTAMKSPECSEYMEVFHHSGAASALVLLLLSPIESNRICAEESLRLILQSSEDHTFARMHSLYAPMLWDFFKLLAKSAPSHPLYSAYRSALSCLLDNALNCGSLFNESFANIIVLECAPVVNKLSISLYKSLQTTAWESTAKGMSAHFSLYIKDGSDFADNVPLLCKAMKLSNKIWTKNSKGKPRMFLGYQGTLRDFIEVEIGSQRWLTKMFYELLEALDGCLATVQLVERPLRVLRQSTSVVENSFRSTPFLLVLKGLQSIAQLYEDTSNYLHETLAPCASALNLLIKQSQCEEEHSWLLGFKSLLNFESKKKLVMGMLPKVRHSYHKLNFVVPRSDLLSKSFEALAYVSPDALQKGISAAFEAEDASGPGVLREWFFLICQEIFNPQNALFKCCPSDGRRVFPNPASGVNCGHLTYFRFCGRVVALALMHKVQINVMFSLAFLKQLAGLPISWRDARDADPMLYESCKSILEMDVEDVDSDVLGLTFVCEEQQLGKIKPYELCPEGKSISVNSKNRLDYIERLIRHRFVTSVVEQVQSFSQGFSEILRCGSGKQFFRGLEARDYDSILHGQDHVICLDDWKRHTTYHEYRRSSNQIIWFWKVLESMTNEQRRKILFFSTSVAYLPAEGFAGLPSKFHIYKGYDSTLLPTSHTCFFQLVLPRYRSFDVMRRNLLLLTEDHIAESFGFA